MGGAGETNKDSSSLRNGPNRKRPAVHGDSVWQIRKGLARAIRVACRCLDAGKLNRKRSPGLSLELLRSGIECDVPAVDVCVVRLGADAVPLPTKHAPLYVVEVPCDIALADVEVDAVREVPGEVVDGPIQTVLLRLVGARGVALVAVPKVAAATIRRPDAPELGPSRLGSPSRSRCRCGSRADDDVILDVLTEDSASIYREAVGPGGDAGDGDLAAAADLAPVLAGCVVKVVVLKVPSVARKYRNGLRDTCWKSDAAGPSAATRTREIAADVLRNRVVEVGIPAWIRKAAGIFSKVVYRGTFCALVEVVILLQFQHISPVHVRGWV